jgi:calpain-15
MAEIPERVEACFHTKEINSAGIYLMSFFINGVVSPVIVDDHVPVSNGRPCFSSTKDGEMWAMLLDKAWAKL